MAAAPEDSRKKAADLKRQLEAGAASAGLAATSSALAGGGAPLAKPLALVGALMGTASLVVGWWADDPPRPDFNVGTRLLVRQPRLELIPETPLAPAARDLAYWLAFSDGCLRSGLRAFEREQGAEEADAQEHALARRRERVRYTGLASDGLHRTAEQSDRFAAAFPAELGDLGPLPDSLEQLPDSLLAWLYRAEVPLASAELLVALMNEHAEAVRPAAARQRALTGLGAALGAFARALDEWRASGAGARRPDGRQRELFDE